MRPFFKLPFSRPYTTGFALYFFNGLYVGACVTLWSLWVLAAYYTLFIDVGAIFPWALLTYGLLPIKQPCDYSSYQAWWSDRANWGK